jgi:hypothetical protein
MVTIVEDLLADRSQPARQQIKARSGHLALTAIASVLLGTAALTGCAFGREPPVLVRTPPAAEATAGCALPCTSTGAIDPVWLAQFELTLRRLVAAQFLRGPWPSFGFPRG